MRFENHLNSNYPRDHPSLRETGDSGLERWRLRNAGVLGGSCSKLVAHCPKLLSTNQ